MCLLYGWRARLPRKPGQRLTAGYLAAQVIAAALVTLTGHAGGILSGVEVTSELNPPAGRYTKPAAGGLLALNSEKLDGRAKPTTQQRGNRTLDTQGIQAIGKADTLLRPERLGAVWYSVLGGAPRRP